MTTWKQRKKAAKRHNMLLIGLALCTLLGGILLGYWWASTQSTVPQLTSDLERIKSDVATAKFAQEQEAKIADIHTNIEAVLLKILDVYSKHSQIVEAAEKNVSKNKKDTTKRELEMMWESAFSPLHDSLTQLETLLSELEKREPRNFDLPAPPSMIVRKMKK